MATSFRFSPEEELQLKRLARKLGKTKTEIIKLALVKLAQEQSQKESGSILEALREAGFKPLPIDIGDLAHDEKKQRDFIKGRLHKKYGG